MLGRSPGIFCCMRAMKPGILSLDEGVGWIYTCRPAVSLSRIARNKVNQAHLALGEQELHAATRAAMHDCVILPLLIVAHIKERSCRRGC